MKDQLELLPEVPRELLMTAWYRRIGIKGVRNARLALAAKTLAVHHHDWKVTHTTRDGKLVSVHCRGCPQRGTANVDLYTEEMKEILAAPKWTNSGKPVPYPDGVAV